MRDGWTRRAVLGTAGAAGLVSALAGCEWFRDDPTPPPPDPLEPLLVGTRTLAGRYEQVLAAHPELADRLRPLQEAHLAHEAALLEMIGRPELATPTPAATPGGAVWVPPDPEDPEEVSDDVDQALAALRAAEQDGRAEAADTCLAASPERAALLGSITAARACHAEVLA